MTVNEKDEKSVEEIHINCEKNGVTVAPNPVRLQTTVFNFNLFYLWSVKQFPRSNSNQLRVYHTWYTPSVDCIFLSAIAQHSTTLLLYIYA